MRLLLLVLLCSVGCAHADALRVDDDGSDRASVVERWPEAAWLPLQGRLMQHELVVVALVNGLPVRATFDTGASRTSMSTKTASLLGLDDAVAKSRDTHEFVDAHGAAGTATIVVVDSVALGGAWRERQAVSVIPSNEEFLLIGLDLLDSYDMLIVGDQGLIGLFPAGSGPKNDDDLVVPLRRQGNSLIVDAHAPGGSGTADAELIIDTGAMGTSFPSAPALLAGVGADLRFTDKTRGVASDKDERGRFFLNPLRLGENAVDVGTVAAWEAIHNDGNGPGLLGADVFLRFRTLIAPRTPELRLRPLPARPATRVEPPAGRRCGGDLCLRVSVYQRNFEDNLADLSMKLDQLSHAYVEAQYREQMGLAPNGSPDLPVFGRSDGACLAVGIDAAWGGHVVEFAVADADPVHGVLAGGVVTVVVDVPAGGFSQCIELPENTQRLGLSPQTPLSVRFVRFDRALQQRCSERVCAAWNGP